MYPAVTSSSPDPGCAADSPVWIKPSHTVALHSHAKLDRAHRRSIVMQPPGAGSHSRNQRPFVIRPFPGQNSAPSGGYRTPNHPAAPCRPVERPVSPDIERKITGQECPVCAPLPHGMARTPLLPRNHHSVSILRDQTARGGAWRDRRRRKGPTIAVSRRKTRRQLLSLET